MDNSSKLKLLMIQYDKTPDDVAVLLSREKSTVYQWTAKNVEQQIPDQLLELLQLKLTK
jgi:hypothetical protein